MAAAEEILQDDMFRFNLEAFLPYICECVAATDLLVHLHYFTREQRKEIFKMYGPNNVAAMRRAMEILLHEKEDPGRFKAIRDAIEESEYPKIVQMLDGKTVPCDENCRKIIDLFTNEIIRRLNPEELLPNLVCQGTVTHVDAEEVRAEERNHGKTRACWILLFHLPNRVENWFRNFVDALLDNNYKDIAELLDPDFFKKVMDQRKASSIPLIDTRENVLKDNNSSYSTLEKGDLEQPEKGAVSASNDNFDNEYEKVVKNCGLDSFIKEMNNLKMTEETACKQLVVEDVTDGKLRNKEGDDAFCDSLTNVKLLAQAREKRNVGSDKRIRYDREFLLACRDSPLTKIFPKGVEKYPEIMVPITLPGRSDTEEKTQYKEGIAVAGSLTNAKVLAQVCEDRNFKSDKRIQYDREFLLACRDSPLTKHFPKGIEKYPEIMVPVMLPRRSDMERLKSGEGDSSDMENKTSDIQNKTSDMQNKTSDMQNKISDSEDKTPDVENKISDTEDKISNMENEIVETEDEISDMENKTSNMENEKSDMQLNISTLSDMIYENNFEDIDNEAEIEEEPNMETLDFEFLLTESSSLGPEEGDVNPGVDHDIRQAADGAIEPHSDQLEDGNTDGRNEDIYVRNISTSPARVQRQMEENMVAIAFPEEQNNLDTEGELFSLDETDYNIITDADEVDADDEDIPLREYQKELAKEGSEGDNVIVMAPTNTGKTRVACRIIQVHLRGQRQTGKIGKVIFLVENEALALQQGKECADRLPAYRTKVISGSIQRDKKQFLRDFVDRRDILVVTAQVLLNALKLKEINRITTFSMIVFDECHHTDNYHRFNEIMGHYMDLKLRHNLDAEQLPQIVGLTASLGVGGNTNENAAMNHMKGLLANLDTKFLCTVRKNKEELRYFENNPIEETVAAKRRENDLYRQKILDIMDIIADYMLVHRSMENLSKGDEFIKEACCVPPCRGSEKFLQWLSDFKKNLGKLHSDSVRRMMNPCRIHLELYNKALLIHADARIKDAASILEVFMEEERKITPKNDTDVFLLELYDNLKLVNFNDEPENPKLVEMERIVMGIFANNDDARGIAFVKTRELAQALVNWMKETEPLKSLNATEFVGQVASKADGGMTKCAQKDALEYFKGGRHKIVIATSVAEEGLDITKCNLVIRYEHVTNEIVRLQSRGRARQQNSRYYVLTEEGSWIVAKEEKNALLERVMNIIVPQLQVYIEDHPNLWEQELRKMQEEQKQEEELKEEQRLANMSNDEHEFRCLNCNKFICFLSDIRQIQNAHHVAVDEEVPKRVISVRNQHPKFMVDELKFDGGIFCGNVDCQRELGGVCEYKHAEFPLLKITNFRVVNKNGQGKTFKKWKKANFRVQQFTLDDLREVVERRRAAI